MAYESPTMEKVGGGQTHHEPMATLVAFVYAAVAGAVVVAGAIVGYSWAAIYEATVLWESNWTWIRPKPR